MTKLVIISDTHNLHNDISLPNGDVLIHCGDITRAGTTKELKFFADWLKSVPHSEVIIVPGNHDGVFQEQEDEARQILNNSRNNVHVLIDQPVECFGHKFYGSPWTPEFFDWWFMKKRGEELKEVWHKIPKDTEVLITHGPPCGILDVVVRGYGLYENVGCVDLANAISNLDKLKLSLFGHIHSQYGMINKFYDDRIVGFVNAALVNDRYTLTRNPVVLDI